VPAISRIRYTNVVYENGAKRYIDNSFQFEGHNGVILLENGGGKTVFLQTLIQAILPHEKVADRKIAETLLLNNNIAHIAVEWILNDNPRRYALTAVSLFMNGKDELASYKFAYEYGPQDGNSIEKLPFVRSNGNKQRPANRDEIAEFYRNMSNRHMVAKFFSDSESVKSYQKYIEDSFKIIPAEWSKLAVINTSEGGVEEYFSKCSTTGELVDRLLVPTVEEALAGNGTQDFVELFEQQREHFRRQIELRNRIQECQGVDQELTAYNRSLKAYYDLELSLTIYKQELKAAFQVVNHDLLECADQLSTVQRAHHNNKGKLKYNSQQEQGLELAIAEGKVADAQTQEQLAKVAYDHGVGIMIDKQTQCDNLQVAKYKASIKLQDEIIDDAQQAIGLLENDEETLDIQDELDENSEELKGYFVDQEHGLNSRLGQVEQQLQNMETEKGVYIEAQSNIDLDMQKIQRKIGDAEGKIEIYVNLQDKIERQLLADNINETVEAECEKWKNQLPKLQADQEYFQQRIAQYDQEKQESKMMIPQVQGCIDQLKGEESKNNNEINNVKKQLAGLVCRIKYITELSSIVMNATDIYQRKESIINQLEANLEYLRRDKEQALRKERLAHKLLDEYADNNYFTADGALEKRINSWRDGFTFLENGTEYYQRACNLGNNPAEIYNNYPFWTITVITTDKELDKLTAKFESCQHEMTHAVILLTEQEARDIVSGTRLEFMRQVIPSFWFGNMLTEDFASWLSNMRITATEASNKKQRVEEDFNNCQNLLKEARNFYNEYSFNEYQQLLNSQLEVNTKLEFETKKLQALHESLEAVDKLLQSYDGKLVQVKDDIKDMNVKLEQASEYFVYKRKHLEDLTEKNALGNKLTELQAEKVALQLKITTVSGVLSDLNDEQKDIENSLHNLRSKPFYQEVQTARIKATPVTYDTLANRRRTLLDKLDGKQQNRGKLQEQLKNSLEKKNELGNQLQDFRQSVDSSINEEYLFPTGGEEDLKRLRKELQNLKNSKNQLATAHENTRLHLAECNGGYKTQEQAYNKLYTEKITFTQELAEVKKMLMADKVSLEAQGRQQACRISELTIKFNEFEKVINKLKEKNGKLEFLWEGVKEILVTTIQADKLAKDVSGSVDELLSKAEQLYNEVQDKRNDSEKSKRSFITYCEREIKDNRLKRSIIDGTIAKTSYVDFFNWQIKMKERIATAIRLAEREAQEHYTHTEQIINHVYTHIVSIAEELRTIPGKTRVKIDDGYKDIFVFHVPEWEEKQGKEILRNYFDALTKKIDNPEFKDENGNYILGKVKKSLQVWLKAQQLLIQLLGEKQIKVKCRKATNDNRISSYAYSWEESNKWSGGEKWSKNMALFLGCLNYLAEKRKHLSFSAKRNRVVIADNPFGKASSDHVLNPVFFICQQLGFQFIALTAHDEGDFIRKYFPIVYSCRFDYTKDHKGQVIHAEKEIKTAFFREHDPVALERLNEYKHMDLFELV